jgi:hypothetical protein
MSRVQPGTTPLFLSSNDTCNPREIRSIAGLEVVAVRIPDAH